MAVDPGLFGLVDELEVSRPGSPWTADGHRNYTRQFLVQVRQEPGSAVNKAVGAAQVCQAPGLPLPGAPYILGGNEGDLGAVAVRFSAERVPENPYFWIVTVEYSTQVPEGGLATIDGFGDDAGAVANNPELRPWHIEWDYKAVTKVPQTDLYGFPFLNSANQPFSPPYQQEDSRVLLHLVFNLRTFSRQTATKYSYVCNSDTFLGCAPGTVLCHPPRAALQWYGGISYFRTRWMLEFGGPKPLDPDVIQWLIMVGAVDPELLDEIMSENYDELENLSNVQILNQGLCRLQFNPLSSAYGKPVPIYNHMGQAITQPDLLNSAGQPVVPDADGYRAPSFRTFHVRRQVQFEGMFTQGLGGLV